MANLQNVIDQLKVNNMEQKETSDEVSGLNNRIATLVTMMKINNLDLMEALREKPSPSAPGQPAAAAAGGGGGFGLPPIAGLGAIGATLLAIGASITGLDTALRALKIGDIMIDVSKAVMRAIKAIRAFGTGVVNVFARLIPAATEIGNIIRAGFKAIPDGAVKFFDDLKLKIFTTIPEDVAKVTARVSKLFDPIRNGFNAVSELLRPVTTGLTAATESAGKILGSVLDFFQTALKVLDPFLGPIKTVLKAFMRPFIQIALTVVDFVEGFFKGFTGAGEDATFFDKLTAGIEGGIKGVIRGITEAIDLIFFGLPAWIAGQLGFDGVAEKIKEFNVTQFVDPIFDGIKKFFTEAFTGELELPSLSGATDFASDLLKTVLRAVLPDPNADTFSFAGLAAVPLKKTGVYEFAGYKENSDGQMVLPPAPAISAPTDSVRAAGAAAADRAPPTGAGVAPIINAPSSVSGDINNIGGANSMVTPMATSHDPTLMPH
jgi:hypothetical protein